MNPLKLDLAGKVVVLSADCLNLGVDPRFFCEGGFGCHSFTMGHKIHGRFICDGEEATIDSRAIERLCDDQAVRPRGQAPETFSSIGAGKEVPATPGHEPGNLSV